MSFTIDSRDVSNNISLNITLPSDATGTVLLDFFSEYDREDYFRTLDVTQTGPWIVGTIPNDRIPPTDTYKVDVYAAVEDHLAFKDIHIPFKDIMVAFKDIVGPSRNEKLSTVQGIIIGDDYQTQTEITEVLPSVTEYVGLTDTVVERVSNNENAKATTYR